MLDDDRHFVGEAFGQMLGDVDPGHARLEGDVEMVPAGQPAGLLDLVQHAPDHFAQRLLDDLVIGNQGLRGFVAHGFSW